MGKWKIIVRPDDWVKGFGSDDFGKDASALFYVEEPDILDVFRFGGKQYVVSMKNPKNKTAFVNELFLIGYDTNSMHVITCPYCGDENQDSWELSQNSDDYECENCGAIMWYEREIEVSYSSKLIKPPTVIDVEK